MSEKLSNGEVGCGDRTFFKDKAFVFEQSLKEKIELIDKALDECLPKEIEYPAEIFEAMRYSIFAGGKRIRPVLLLSACESLNGSVKLAIPFACAIELIHTYSLIHDDLPALDNDDYRRGKLTNHMMFGEDMAILAGDALLHHACEIMSNSCVETFTIENARAMQAILHGAGVFGMLSGQVVDVFSEGKPTDEETLLYIHKNKTASMISGALKAGALIAGASEEDAKMFCMAGEKIGLAFQMQDDILDVIGTKEELGKPIGSDFKNEKMTFVKLYGLDKCKQMVEDYSNEAIEIFKKCNGNTDFISELTRHLIGRNS